MRKILCIVTVFMVMVTFFIFPSSAADAAYTNLADPTSSSWLVGYRLTFTGAVSAEEGIVVTNFINVNFGDIVRIQGLDLSSNARYRVALYDSSGTYLYSDVISDATAWLSNIYVTDNFISFTVNSTDIVRIRFCGVPTDDEVIITLNEEIVESVPDELPTISAQIHGTRSQRLKDYISDVESGSMSGIRHTMSDSVEHIFTDVFPGWASVAVWIADRVQPDLFVYLCVMVIIFSIVGGYKNVKNE